MTVTVKKEDYEALKKAYAQSEIARARSTRAIHWAVVAVVIAFAGVIIAGFGFYDYSQNQRDEDRADIEQSQSDAQQVCDNAVANRETAREQDFASVAYVDGVLDRIIAFYGGIPHELQSELDQASDARNAEINEQRPPLDPNTCPPVPLPPPSIPTSTGTTTPTTEEP